MGLTNSFGAGGTLLLDATLSPEEQLATQQLDADTLRVNLSSENHIRLLAREWSDLCLDAEIDEPFFHPGWFSAYLKNFEPSAQLRLFTVRDASRLLAVLPLIEDRSSLQGMPIRRLRAAANFHSPRFDLVARRGPAGQAAIQALAKYFAEARGWDVIEFPFHLGNGPITNLAKAAASKGLIVETQESWHSLHLPIPSRAENESNSETAQPWMEGSSSQFRKQMRRRWSQLESQGPLVLRRSQGFDSEMFQRFCEVEQSGWKGKGGTAIASNRETLDFYRQIGQQAGESGGLSLYLLEFNGRAIAGHFGFEHRGRYLLQKAGYDEEFAKYGPGHLLVYAVLRDCWERGLKEFDFVGPAMDDEARWAKESRNVMRTVMFRGVYGRLIHSIEYPIKKRVKTLLKRS